MHAYVRDVCVTRTLQHHGHLSRPHLPGNRPHLFLLHYCRRRRRPHHPAGQTSCPLQGVPEGRREEGEKGKAVLLFYIMKSL